MKKLALLVLVFCTFAMPAHAAALVDINTADISLLETLSGIGPSKAAAIVEYRAEHGAFAQTSDIENVSGIGPSTFANIQALITIGAVNVASASDESIDASSTPDAPAPISDAASDPVPEPGALSVRIVSVHTATLGTPVAFSASVSQGGSADAGANVSWSFGDGSSASGRVASKAYRYAGSYAIRASAVDGDAQGTGDVLIAIVPPHVRIAAVSGEGITLANDATTTLDLSGWKLEAGPGYFILPQGMEIMPGASAFLPDSITSLPVSFDAQLLAPDGSVAATYTVPMPAPSAAPAAGAAQPSPVTPSSYKGSNLSTPAHATEPVRAPAASTEVLAAGAALSDASTDALSTASTHSGLGKLLASPWVLGLAAVLAFSGGALIVL